MFKEFHRYARGIPRGGVAVFEEFRIYARGIPKGGVAFFKEFRISARGIPRGGLFLEEFRISARGIPSVSKIDEPITRSFGEAMDVMWIFLGFMRNVMEMKCA